MSKLNIKKKNYCMASADGLEADITMYGDVVDTQPRDWWTDEPIEGNFIAKDEFIADLSRLSKCKKITLHIDSFGGDASASLFIHNKLRDMADAGTELVAVIDGVAMSAATHIACACNTVKIPPSALFMIHKCWSFVFGGYNADEMREMAKSNDAWDNAQAEIYKRKTGLSETVIKHMMSETTYMTGREAVEKGFCDELLETAEVTPIAASADRSAIVVHGRTLHLAKGMKAPEFIPTVTASEQGEVINNKQSGSDTDSNEGGNIPMARNLEELRTEDAELAAQVEAEVRAAVSAENDTAVANAATAERTRLSEIDAIANLFDEETVREAKYGEHPCTAQEMTYRAAQKAAKSGSQFMTDLKNDHEKSQAAQVPATATNADDGKPKTSEERMTDARNQIHGLFKKED